MNSHADIQVRLSAYCSGDLDPAEFDRITEHLATCPTCRSDLADLQTTLRLINSTPEIEPPPWMVSRIMARVQEQQNEKRSWLQRFFLPLHIKLPIEVMALLVVCVSGYYLTRTVETNMEQATSEKLQDTSVQQTPPSEPSPSKPSDRKKRTGQTAPPAPKQNMSSEESRTIVKPVSPQSPPQQPASPALAPPPPPYKQERNISPGGSGAEAQKPAAATELFDRAPGRSLEMKKGTQGTVQKEADQSAVRTKSVTKAPAGILPPQVTVHLNISDAESAYELIQQAISRSGGILVANGAQRAERQLMARIAAPRLTELLNRLEKLGTLTERPVVAEQSGLIEVAIQW
jgi:hypothetical protein